LEGTLDFVGITLVGLIVESFVGGGADGRKVVNDRTWLMRKAKAMTVTTIF